MWTPTPPAPGIALLKSVENCKLRAYPDQGGVPTIGYGHTLGVKLGTTCTQTQADIWLEQDCAWAWAAVQKHVEVPLNINQAGALLSFVYNLGEPQFVESSLLKALNFGHYSAVPGFLNQWIFETIDGQKRVNEGLKNRRDQEAALWIKPVS